MLQFIPVFDGNTIAVRASGKLSHEDYQSFIPQLEEQIKTYDKVSLLFEFEDFKGWDLAAAKDDYKFGMQHLANFDRIAMVGDKAWEHWMAFIAKPFLPSGQVRYFNRENLQDAWDWLREVQAFEKLAEQLQPYENIVVPVDFTLYSKHACKRAVELASHYNASLTVLNIAEEDSASALYGEMLDGYMIDQDVVEKQNQWRLDAAESKMAAFVSELEADIPVNIQVISGGIKYSIVSFLEANKTDLVVFGAKKKTGLNKLLGSIPHYVQNHSRCEVLVVPVQELSFDT